MSQTLHQLAEASDVSRILFQGSPQAAAVRVLQTTLYALVISFALKGLS